MRYFGKTKGNWAVLAAAVVLSLAVRLTVYTEDCNLLVMVATFVVIYTVLVVAVTLVERVKG